MYLQTYTHIYVYKKDSKEIELNCRIGEFLPYYLGRILGLILGLRRCRIDKLKFVQRIGDSRNGRYCQVYLLIVT